MDWLLATPQIQSVFTSLGSFQGDTYVVSPNALDLLNEIEHKLNYEDQTLRTFRRAIGFCQNVRTDLIPLLVNAKDDDVLELVIRILVNLTIPVECLFSVDVMYRTDVGRHTIFELNKLLYTSKKAFTDPKSTKPVIDFIKHILQSDTKMTPPKCEQINNCLLLLRNVLHIPETHANFIVPDTTTRTNGASCANVSMQNSILWNLFIQSIDKLLLYLITYHQRQFWGVTIVQLIGLLYKDQNVGTLQKLLNMWVEASLSDSSEDNESNTTLQKQASGDSSPMLTSDSSDNGKSGGELKRASSRHTYVYNRVIDLITSNTDVEAKDNTGEERRQAQREITDVGSKDQSYQNSVCRMPEAEDNRMTVECLTLVEVEVNKTQKHSNENVEAMDGDFSARVSEECDETKEDEAIDMEQSSSVKKHISTDDMNFKSPSGLPVKAKCDAKSETENTIGQKIGNSVLPPKNDNGTFYAQKRQCASSQSEFTDGEYANQIDNTALVCTSSNDDDGPQAKPQHKKPPWNSKPRSVLSSLDKKELRRKKLVKRSKSSLINMKGLVQHIPTDEDISNLLKEFTVDFLLMGYGLLVEELHSQLLTDIKIPIDTSHFFWLVTYFLKFAAQLELDMKHVNTILNFDVISYLTYEGVSLCEQLDLNAREEGSDLKPYLRRIHLVVTAIQEFLQAIEAFKKIPHLTEEDREQLEHLQIQISATEDLRSLFILLLRRFNPALHTKQYLKDLIVTNHLLLIILDSVAGYSDNNKINMMEHISQFGTTEVMHYYGMLLEDFHNNGEFVNNCIFTTMHHIGGDLQLVSTLFQPVILKTFSRIWETEYDLCDDWTDLIEYVIHKFINTPQKRQLAIPKASLTELTKEHNLENAVSSWRKEDMDTLYWYYVQSKKNRDVVGKIVNLFNSNGKKHNTRISIIQQLLQQDIITLVEYDDLMKFEDAEYQRTLFKSPQAKPRESVIESKDTKPSTKPANDIEILKNLIIKEKKEKHLVWLQKILLECCYIKLTLAKPDHKKQGYQSSSHVMEPVAYHYILKNKPIPVVQWNNDQMSCMLYQPFILLLRKLGFQTPSETGTIYARVPESWTPATMFALAKKLGPLDKLKIKFDVRELDKVTETDLGMMDSSPDNSIQRNAEDLASNDDNMSGTGRLETVQEVDEPSSQVNYAFPKPKHCNSIIRSSPMPAYVSSVPNWLQLVMRSKCNVNLANASGQNNAEAMSNSESIAATSAPVKSNNIIKTNATATSLGSTTTSMICQSINNLIETNVMPSSSTIKTAINSQQQQQQQKYQHHRQQYHQQQQHQQQQQQQQQVDDVHRENTKDGDDDDDEMNQADHENRHMQKEYSAMVASVFEKDVSINDHALVASDLKHK